MAEVWIIWLVLAVYRLRQVRAGAPGVHRPAPDLASVDDVKSRIYAEDLRVMRAEQKAGELADLYANEIAPVFEQIAHLYPDPIDEELVGFVDFELDLLEIEYGLVGERW